MKIYEDYIKADISTLQQYKAALGRHICDMKPHKKDKQQLELLHEQLHDAVMSHQLKTKGNK